MGHRLTGAALSCFLFGRANGFLPSHVALTCTSFTRCRSNNNCILGRSRLSMLDSEKGLSLDKMEDSIDTDDMVTQTAQGKAVTRTVNERLLQELEDAAKKEKVGARSSMGKKFGLESFESSKTDAERRIAIEEAQNLNGVNPAVALAGGAFALVAAAGLWLLTTYLATFFALHPVNSDVYFIQRVSGVFRNVVMGLASLASGFFGVTGLGIGLLGVRVAYGIVKGELDPTPLKKNHKDELEIPNVWDLMMNKKRGRR